MLRAAAPVLSTAAIGRTFSEADTLEELREALQSAGGHTNLQKLGQMTMVKARSVQVGHIIIRLH